MRVPDGTGRRCRSRRRYLVPDRRLLRARRAAADAVARLRRRPGGPRSSSTTSSPRSTPAPRHARWTPPMTDRDASPSSTSRPSRTPSRPMLTARVGVAASGDDPVHAIALRCQVRIEPLRRRYSDDEAAGLLDLFGPASAGPSTQRTFLWQHCTAMVQGFTGRHDGRRCRWSAPTTSRWPPPSICTRCATARSRCSSCSAERFSSSPSAASRSSRCRGTARTATTCRSRSGGT